jgi:hypothetical protein
MIKKRVVFFLVFTVLVSGLVSARLGVSPAVHEVNFVPGLEESFHFNFISDDNMGRFAIEVEGDLAEYITLSKEEIVGSGEVDALMKLPQVIEKPGTHRILVGARQLSREEGGTHLLLAIRGVIKVNVPYPGKYAELELETEDANAGEPIKLNLKIYSRGKEAITTDSKIEIYDLQNRKVETLDLGEDMINSGEFVEIDATLNTVNYGSGNYKVKAVVEYGGREAEAEGAFRLGELFVKVVDYSKEFKRNRVSPFVIVVESFWNDPVEIVYAEGEVLGYENIEFKTPLIRLEPWQRGSLSGYLDTSTIEEETFQARVVLHYENKTSEEILDLRFEDESADYYLIVLIAVAVLAIVLQVWNMWRYARGRKRKR